MRHTMTTIRSIGLAALVGLTGCFSLARNEPAQQHFVLGGSLPADRAEPSRDGTGLAIGIRRLQLATYLESPFIVIRRGDNEITFSEFNRWGERLDGGISQAVSRHLLARAPFRAVDVAPWAPRAEYDYLVQLQVLRFEGLAPEDPAATQGVVHVLAVWEIIRQTDGAVLARGTTDYREPGWAVDDYAGLVTSLDRGLAVLSGDLIGSIEALEGSAGRDR
jgi:uncharacterized lipoprotein YmbA